MENGRQAAANQLLSLIMPDEETFERSLDDLVRGVRAPDGKFLAESEAVSRLVEMRLVYADWLEERGDPRAAHQRWMARERKLPRFSGSSWDWWGYGDRPDCTPEDLPLEIWRRLPGQSEKDFRLCKVYPTRASAENALFKALSLLDLLH
jgi:hypothetical protein